MQRVIALLFIVLTASSQGFAQLTKTLKRLNTNSDTSCVNESVQKDLIDSIAYMAGTIDPSHLHLAFQGNPNVCMLNSLWLRGIATCVELESGFWNAVNSTTYQLPIQFVLVGDLSWLSTVMTKKTHWFWVDTTKHDTTNAKKSTSSQTPDQTSLAIFNSPLPFPKAMNTISAVIKEGVRGVLFSAGSREPIEQNPGGADSSSRIITRWVNIASIDAPGDGTWELKHAATWTYGIIRIFRPLWPSIPFDLLGRTVGISCLKKPTVFEWNVRGARLQDTSGYAADLAKEIQKRLNFTDKLVINTGFGALANGSWNGMVGDLYRGLADVSPTDFTPIWQRTFVIDFGLIYGIDPVVIISKSPAIYIRPLLVLEIFTPFVWSCMVIIGILAGAVMGGLSRLRSALGLPNSWTQGPAKYAGASLKILVYQGSPDSLWPSWIGARIIGGCMMFMSLVCATLYSGSITAFLAIPSRSQAINSLEELLAWKVVPAIRLLSSPYSFFLTENSGPIGDQVRKVMVTFSGTDVAGWDFMQKVADGTYAWIDTASSAIGSASQFEKTGKQCLYHVAKNPVRMDLDAFAYPKNSIIRYQFDEIMRWYRNFGIIEHMKKKYYAQGCIDNPASDGPQIISITQLQGAFYVLGIGIILAAVFLILEYAIHLCVRKKCFG